MMLGLLLPCRVMGFDNTLLKVDAPNAFQEQLLLVNINQQQLNQTTLVLEDKNEALYLLEQDLQNWRLRLSGSPVEYQGKKYYPLKAIAGVSSILDPKTLTLKIEAHPEAFVETSRTAYTTTMPKPTKSDNPGGFINYDLLSTHTTDSTQLLGQFELGYFNRFGVGTSNLLTKDFINNPGVIRLDTTWNVDFPETRQTLRLGNTTSNSGTWGRSVRFGGIQFGTNFGTQPGFIRFPTQSASSLAVLPSTVDVFVNNTLQSRQTVPPGPFSINNLPVVTGAGEVQLVVHDFLGREQLTTLPFYSSRQLLREGLEDFSYELGVVRENFGIDSFDYGHWLGAGTYRRGISDHFTGEVHAEALLNQATIGTGGDYLLPQVGTISTYLAGSHRATGNGGLILLGINRQSQQWSFGARTQWMSRDFTQFGQLPGGHPPIHLSSARPKSLFSKKCPPIF